MATKRNLVIHAHTYEMNTFYVLDIDINQTFCIYDIGSSYTIMSNGWMIDE
jgi:hypothetical protein